MPWSRFTPLHGRLLLLVAVALLPLAAASAAGVIMLGRQQGREIERTTLDTMRALSSAVDSDLNHLVGVAETLAASRQLDTGDLRGFYEHARRVMRTRDSLVGVILADPSGQQIVNTLRPFGVPLPTHLDTENFQRVVQTQKPAVGNVTRGRMSGLYDFPVRVPVIRGGELRYVLTVLARPDAVRSVIARQRVPSDGLVSIFDARGNYVARSRGHDEFIGRPAPPGLLTLMSHRAEGWGRLLTLDGQTVYAAFSRSNENGWSTAVGIPAAAIDTAVRGSYVTLGAGLVASAALGAALALLLSRLIVRPIAALRTAAQALGRGEAPTLPTTSIPEIRDVADALAGAAGARRQAEATREELLRREQAARADAEDANRMKDEFLAMLGHELRNPLGAIRNAVAVLEARGADDDVARRAQEIVGRQVGHLARLMDDLLDVGRVMTGKIVLNRAPLDLSAAVEQSLTTIGASGRLSRHTVTIDLDSIWIDADATRIEQVIGNLVTNAAKYTPPGGRIAISVMPDRDRAVLRVMDDGVGMSPELVPRVFDLFVQGERALDRAQGGLGIGLTLVRRLVELHDGTVAAHSDGVGKGSVFMVTLPAVAAPATLRGEPSEPSDTTPRRVLVVEDNDDSREMLRQLLQVSGHVVYEAADGTSGVETALKQHPDVALIDVGLPGIDGYQVAQRIRTAADAAPMLLIAITGYGGPDDRRRAHEAGFDIHLVKPVDPHALARALHLR